jgi:hypothetical protein
MEPSVRGKRFTTRSYRHAATVERGSRNKKECSL